jgi:RNA polymerase sigma-70 factor (ECF subfamily)
VVELNRIIVLAKINGSSAGLRELRRIENDPRIRDYNLLYATKAQFLSELGKDEAAADSYRQAIQLTKNESVLRFLRRRIEDLRPPLCDPTGR